jgi:hypothetical protein
MACHRHFIRSDWRRFVSQRGARCTRHTDERFWQLTGVRCSGALMKYIFCITWTIIWSVTLCLYRRKSVGLDGYTYRYLEIVLPEFLFQYFQEFVRQDVRDRDFLNTGVGWGHGSRSGAQTEPCVSEREREDCGVGMPGWLTR